MDVSHQPAPIIELHPECAHADASPHQLFHQFMGVMRVQRLLLHRAFAREEMHPSQGLCLRMLSARGEMNQSELAEAMVMTRPSVTRILQRMERAGLIWRRTDEADQRHTRVGLTPTGRALQQRMDAAMAEYVEATLGRLAENEREELARILVRWRALADQAVCRYRADSPAPERETSERETPERETSERETPERATKGSAR
jgi:DNA-binding MarR family transcriptional regulator